jgi:hypothetical protein
VVVNGEVMLMRVLVQGSQSMKPKIAGHPGLNVGFNDD